MRPSALTLSILGLLLSGVSAAQTFGPAGLTPPVPGASTDRVAWLVVADASLPDLVPSDARLQMSADLALETFRKLSARQSQTLAGYSAATLIRAELPRVSQRGELKLERHYSVPRTLTFKALHFVGDGFVKTNVIARLLQSEVDHV